MRKVTVILAALATIAITAGTVMADGGSPRHAASVQLVSHGHHGHSGHHGYPGYRGHTYRYHGGYGHPAVVYPVPVYPPRYGYPCHVPSYRVYSYPGGVIDYRGRNFGFSIGF
ncbi:MAG: hypothetical protein GXY83_01065 [Rhodopirellula sp.]|nr:hypothetical protein [Rhodopirellula sp.]